VINLSFFGDVAPGTPQSPGQRRPTGQGGAGFDSIFVRAPIAVVKLMGKGFVIFIQVVIGSKDKQKKVYFKAGPSWRKWPW